MSDPPKISEGFYGTGESLLFTFVDKKAVKVFAFRSILFFSECYLYFCVR